MINNSIQLIVFEELVTHLTTVFDFNMISRQQLNRGTNLRRRKSVRCKDGSFLCCGAVPG